MLKIKTIFFISFLLISACTGNELQLTEKEEDKIKKEVNESFEGLIKASKSLDADRYFKYFDKEKFTGLNVDGTVWHSINDLEKMIRPGFSMIERIQSLEFNNVKISVINKTTAILVNEYKDTALLKGGELISGAGGGTQVWSKSSGDWRLVNVSGSVKPQDIAN